MRKIERTVLDRVHEVWAQKHGKKPTQSQIADVAGVKQPSVSDWGKPGKYPEMKNAVPLAKKLGVCVEWLLSERGPKTPGTPIDAIADELWLIWPDLEVSARQRILGYAALARVGGERDDTKSRAARAAQ